MCCDLQGFVKTGMLRIPLNAPSTSTNEVCFYCALAKIHHFFSVVQSLNSIQSSVKNLNFLHVVILSMPE